MPTIISYFMTFGIMVVFSVVLPHFVDLSSFISILVLLLVTICFFWSVYWISEFMYRWRNGIKANHEKRFYWYRDMGLFESACLVEPKIAKDRWKWYFRMK